MNAVADPVLTPATPQPPAPARGTGLRIAGRGPSGGPPREPTPESEWATAQGLLRSAAEKGRLDLLPAIARTALELPCGSGAHRSLLGELARFKPSGLADIEDESLWLLRSADASLIGLVRLRGNGLVSPGDGHEDVSWRREATGGWIGPLGGQAPTRLLWPGSVEGRPFLIGLAEDGSGLRFLSRTDCVYSQLRRIDPELTNPMAGLFRPDALVDPALPPVPVVVLAAHRTGSHLLINLLNSSDRVFVDGEILNAGKISLFGDDLPADRKDGLDMLRISDPIRFAKVMMTRSHHTDGRMLDHIPVRGFKLFPEHSRGVFDWAIEQPEVRVIHLHRANLLAEFSSYLAAHRDGEWVGGAERKRDRQVLFDRERFIRFVQMKEQYLGQLRQRLQGRSGRWAEIEYSQISRGSVQGLLEGLLDVEVGDRRLDALGISQQLTPSILARFVNPDDALRCLREIGREAWAEPEMKEIGSL